MLPSGCLEALWHELDGDLGLLDDVTLHGLEPVLPSSFRVGTAAQVSIAAAALAAMAFDRLRGGPRQRLAVAMRHAAIECRSERHVEVNGAPPGELWDDLAGAYPCGDGRTVRLHTNFPHHRAGIVALLAGASTREAIAAALMHRRAEAFETEATDRGLCVAMMRTFAEWDAHPQSAAVAAAPLVRIERVGSAPARGWNVATRPLDGVRVLDLTRIIAGPVAGRTLAAHGADVLRLKGPRQPTIDALDVDTGRGKRSGVVELADPEGRTALDRLLAAGHVFLQSYRPGALERLGYGVDALARRHPGIVIGALSAYGRSGPWADKRGFDSLVQTASGFNVAEAGALGAPPPRPLPLQILDHASGHLLAAGIARALERQASEGGTWHVEVSLARTAAWLRSLGRIEDGFRASEPGSEEVAALSETTGPVRATRHAATLSVTPARFDRAPAAYGTHPPCW